jgi:drug/metabolite transporter (DMT)-like permease
MPHAIMHIIKGQPQEAAQTSGERNEALGLLALCWLLSAGVFIAVKWAGTYTPPWTLVFYRLLFATLFLKEPFGRRKLVATGLAVAGILLVTLC